MPLILVKRNTKLTLAKNIYWTFQLLLLPSSAKITKGSCKLHVDGDGED